MAEPKTPEVDDLKREMKKASKKSSKKAASPAPGESGPSLASSPAPNAAAPKTSPPSSAATPQKPPSSVPKTPPQAQSSINDVPKMNFNAANLGTAAEPKPTEGASDDKLKKKSTKKKAPDATSAEAASPLSAATAPTIGPKVTAGSGAPTAASLQSSTAGPASAKTDDEEERARAAARREAKRQKQKEAEEAKKRKEEMERQALEMARREEEAKQRELRKTEALAALNANAEECQEEDDYDEDFENYDDGDFEDPGEPAQAKKSTKPSSNQQSLAEPPEDLATVQKIREALQAESKPTTSSSSGSKKATSASKPTPVAGPKDAKEAKGAKKVTSGVSASIAGLKQAIDPRAKRIKEILEKKKMETERFDMFQQMPLTDLDKYMSQLRVCAIRQVFVQTNGDARSIQTQTKPRESTDHSMLFPDDMGVDGATDVAGRSSRRFISFLARASHACEVLLEENVMHADVAKADNQRQDDSSMSNTASLDGFRAEEYSIDDSHPLVQHRIVQGLAFSPQVSHWLVGGYGPQDDGDNNAVFADKSILCVWDVNQMHAPVRWLRSEGVVTCVGFGPGRDMFVLSGSEEGAVQVWDLRLPPSPYFEATAIKLKVEPPTYSTAGMKHDHNHRSPIAAVHAIPSSKKGATFQFGSLDNRGLLVIWSVIECRSDSEALSIDSCVEIGGRVKLVKTAVIETTPTALFVGPSANDFAFFPADPNQFVVGTAAGTIAHGSRFDTKLGVKAYLRGGGIAASAVTSLAFHPTLPSYFLAGYADGSISLFHVDLARDIATWLDGTVGVSRVLWSPSRPGVFYVQFANGTLTVWDVLTSRMMPVVSEPSRAKKRIGKALFALSADISRTCRPSIAIAGASPKPLAIHSICGPLTTKAKDESAAVESLLAGVV
ncbi:hypothetical protein H310_03544 [Aphanomyces invadans]|uniref:Uncharacterized protein n=1 Tax=Aphanomyces invadans TaxID=157072 RepID=A0A024UIB1_9STRA|nr:hypothetical protein H310_03544 [Aphanomyces invadans]ETW05895.1 hypothetical protein H310_03544 [Aphanomyces invadans]|eukprot:XP_008865672.1 hypothetical protein H310_03544 [Aphanomyces invadans]